MTMLLRIIREYAAMITPVTAECIELGDLADESILAWLRRQGRNPSILALRQGPHNRLHLLVIRGVPRTIARNDNRIHRGTLPDSSYNIHNVPMVPRET